MAPALKTPQQIREQRLKELKGSRTKDAEAILAIEENQRRQDIRQRAGFGLNKFRDKVMAQAESWEIAATTVGSAYKTAWSTYSDALDKKAKADALESQILFSLLTVVTQGALSWVSSALQKEGEQFADQRILIESIEDATQGGIGEGFSAIGPMVVPPRPGPVSHDPQLFQNDLTNRVKSMKNQVYMAFSAIWGEWQALPLEDWDHFDEKNQMKGHDAWQKDALKLAGKNDLPPEDAMAEEMEKGLWANYILENHSHRDFGITETEESYDWVGSEVAERLHQLRVLKSNGPKSYVMNRMDNPPFPVPNLRYPVEPGIGNYVWKVLTTQLVVWAMTYKPQNYAALKKSG